jgi:serralysin
MATYNGTPGDDLLLGSTENDSIDGGDGNDKLFGAAGHDALYGGAGNDLLDGGSGDDSMTGGTGDDAYYVDNTGDIINELAGEGYDTVFVDATSLYLNRYELPKNVERGIALPGTTMHLLYGNEMANEIVGNEQANRLVGGIGEGVVDTLIGGDGDDTYDLVSLGPPVDIIIEHAGGGYDRVLAPIGYNFTLPDNVERLEGVSASLTGNSLDNLITGSDDAEIIDGGAGADTMIGKGSDDFYVVDNVGDVVQETAAKSIGNGDTTGGGLDTVFVKDLSAYVLPAFVERGVAYDLGSLAALDLTGNELANELVGNAGANWLDGKLGLDKLTGGAGADTFAFTTKVDGDNADLIAGFEVGIDKIALDDAVFTQLTAGALPDSAFHIGREAADADDRILYEASTGNLFYDPDGTGPLASQYFASMHDGLNLSASDFAVI